MKKMGSKVRLSFGVILCYVPDSLKIEYLVIQRKYTYAFTDFVMGRYYKTWEYMASQMTEEEKRLIKECSFSELWTSIWDLHTPTKCFEYEEAEKKFYDNRNKVVEYPISSFLEWEFPKGRKNKEEKWTQCALREFEEETCIPKGDIPLCKEPLSEAFEGDDGVIYITYYYVAMIKEKVYEDPVEPVSKEVRSMKWITIQDLDRIKMTPKKVDILIKINDILKKSPQDIQNFSSMETIKDLIIKIENDPVKNLLKRIESFAYDIPYSNNRYYKSVKIKTYERLIEETERELQYLRDKALTSNWRSKINITRKIHKIEMNIQKRKLDLQRLVEL